MFYKNYKKILIIASIIGIAALFIAGIYYIAIFLPQKQKASMDLVKLELESKIEQEKTEQLKIEQNKTEEEAKKQAELLAEQQESEEKSRKNEESQKNKSVENSKINETARNTCLANVKNSYRKAIDRIMDSYSSNFSGMSPAGIENRLKSQNASLEQASTSYENAKNDCYHKYPLPNEDF